MSVSGIPDEYVEIVRNQFDNNAEDIKTARDQYSRLVQETMQISQWMEFKARLDSIPDVEAVVICFAYFGFPDNQAEMEKAVLVRAQENNVTSETSALFASRVEFAKDSIVEYVSNEISKSNPSEEFLFDNKGCTEISEVWTESKRDIQGIPSDLLFSKELSVLDCLITISDYDDSGRQVTSKSRVCVFPDYKDRIDALINYHEGMDIKGLFLGALIYYINPSKSDPWQLIIPFGAQPEGNILISFQPYTVNLPDAQKESLSVGIVHSIINDILSVWYGIEFSLYGGIPLESKKLL